MTRKPQRFAWDVYADQLYSRGLGYPLWTPERMREGWDVQPLDVGWIREGAFHHLLRATNAAYEDQPFGVTPKGHKPFRFDQRVVMESYRHPLSESRVVCSQSMSDLTFNPTDLSASHGWNMSFKNIDEEGAFLVHRDLWHTKPKVSSKSIEDYIRMNAQKWLAMANETLGIGLELSDLVFVSGCVRTSHWAVGAFSGASPGSSGRLNISEHQSLGPSVTGLLFSDRILPQSWWKNGHMTLSTHDATSPGSTVGTPSPTRPEASQQEVSTGPIASQDRGPSDGGSADATQCVFVNYYKAHRRSIFGKTIKAGAGYHELPPGDKDGGAGGSTAASTEDCPSGDESDHRGNISSSRQTWVDPLRHLLDYILDKSDAELAVACDIELYALFEVQST
ncbi:hypothetical protein FKP32DRAFT_1202913 [Trametes sanguinea]|nr:hypothetical protein FKP32DRAFT_1202913 [Trametes sanguinea]